jgi:hypothetical protein
MSQSVDQLLFGDAHAPPAVNTAEEVFFSSAEDAVFIDNSGGTRHLVWNKRTGSEWRQFWRSRELYHLNPDVQVADFNEDGTRDLFWNFAFEDLIGSMFVLNVRGQPHEVFPVVECGRSTLEQDTNGYRLVVPSAGVDSPDECVEMGRHVCPARFSGEWPKQYRLVGTELREESWPAAIYLQLAAQYRKDAVVLDSLYRASDDPEQAEVNCGVEVVGRLKALADSAETLVGS